MEGETEKANNASAGSGGRGVGVCGIYAGEGGRFCGDREGRCSGEWGSPSQGDQESDAMSSLMSIMERAVVISAKAPMFASVIRGDLVGKAEVEVLKGFFREEVKSGGLERH